ncbi:hypothetical protein [Desulforamulus ruminis]|uniref:PD-(D/E)XK endonuclease-like domain-containing protein n=1 Tax=Desulforamulus ruminis (strain ATCC 23193 / DSM 2154 / NCIMB 8452 / DL) TaxID=696281 RepID=F6DU92_DESRL|nr:hypothetical protein [Desulforamulus ruminis]AEG61277.1 hypothetical protein Desru_3066 [Desulforamulus ruminis DSM 2154]
MFPGDLFVLGILIGGFLLYNMIKLFQSAASRRRVLKAGKAELAARKFLSSEGYKILSVQERVPVVTKINGKSHKSHIQADLIVQKGKEVFVVDVKTGQVAQQPNSPEIRRQLLEYYLVYQTDGVLVLDMDQKKLYRMEFQVAHPSPKSVKFVPYFASFLAGVIFVLMMFKGGYLR